MPTTAESVVKAGRAAQIAQSNAASRNLISAYRGVWNDINGQLARLQGQITTAQASGVEVKVSWLYQQQRLQQLQLQVGDSLVRFTGQAQQLTLGMIQQGARDGSDSALSALQATVDGLHLPPGVDIAFNRLNAGALEAAANSAFVYRRASKDGTTITGVASLYRDMPTDMANRAKQTIISAVATGQHPSVTARALKQQMGIGLNRALTIARTEQMGAYRRASTATFRANADVCDGWEWLAAPDACEFCQSQNGTKHPLDEEMDTHPRCRCVQKPLARSLADIVAAFASDNSSGGGNEEQ